jgi:hypothetical protein
MRVILRSAVLLAGISSVTACTVTQLPDGNYAFETALFQPAPPPVQPATPPAPKPAPQRQSPSVPAGPQLGTRVYTGLLDDGRGTVMIDPISPTEDKVHLTMSANNTYGNVQGVAQRQGDMLYLTQGSLAGGPVAPCVINMREVGDKLQVKEQNCMVFHGGTGSFSGTLVRKG